MGIVALGAAATAHPREPIRREARVELGLRNNVVTLSDDQRLALEQLFGVSDPRQFDFYAAGLIVPSTTTAELASFARRRGRARAVRWFCANYAEPPAGEPDVPSLRGMLLEAATDESLRGARATDAVACPLPVRVRARGRSSGSPIVDAFIGFIAPALRTIARALGREGATISTAACVATDAMREAFDVAACERLLLVPHATRVFSRMTRRAARDGGCLRLRAGESPALGSSAEPSAFFEVAELVPCY